MLSIRPFSWRRLSPDSELEHCVDEQGALRLRSDISDPPIARARVNTGTSIVEMGLDALGMVWSRPQDGDGWILRTKGAPITMTDLGKRWGEIVRGAADPLGIDERFVLVTLACESGNSRPDADGYVRAPRTERGYPRRTSERDPGDFERDAEDWRSSRGAHSSHGLMQTLILVATSVRPDLFQGVDPAHYRTVLWEPTNSLACGLAFMSRFPAAVLSDPLRSRFHYGAPASHRSRMNKWGIAPVYDDRVPLRFIALWNDDASLRTGEGPPKTSSSTPPWIAGVLAFAAAAGAACGLAYLVRKAAGA